MLPRSPPSFTLSVSLHLHRTCLVLEAWTQWLAPVLPLHCCLCCLQFSGFPGLSPEPLFGSNGGRLLIPEVRRVHSGLYRCQLTVLLNQQQFRVSRVILLTVQGEDKATLCQSISATSCRHQSKTQYLVWPLSVHYKMKETLLLLPTLFSQITS